MRQLVRRSRWLRWLSACAVTLLLCISLPAPASAQTWRGVYCVTWQQQIRPHRVIASGHVLAGETVNLIIPPPTLPESLQYVALSWGTDMTMPDTACTWRVVQASGSYLLQPPTTGGTLWEWQIVEVDVRTHDPRNPVVRDPQLDELVVPGSVQHALTWALNGSVITWMIGICLGALLAYQWVRALLRSANEWHAALPARAPDTQSSDAADEQSQEWQR